MSDGTQTNRTYALGQSAEETARLEKQAQLWNPSTRRLLEEAGIGAGMKVLDVGTGAGDVALLAADLVGPSGTVVGVDADPEVLDRARERARATGRPNVSFVAGDLHSVALDDDFDAVVGRAILAHQALPAETLRSLAGHLRPGGIVAFQEIDMSSGLFDAPPSPLHQQQRDWTVRAFGRAGVDLMIGLKLHRVFLDAGLPAPRMHLYAPIGAGPDWAGYDYLARTFRATLHTAQEHGLATAEEVAALDVDTFATRLRDEAVGQRGMITMAPYVGAWARKP
jgi:2-polyprenyl-3-methyl-5-hydroxy-6-metoxy-1,4-benzoquinol methylase